MLFRFIRNNIDQESMGSLNLWHGLDIKPVTKT